MNNLMIVAHPDDESIFGASLLMTEPNWKVICVSCGYQPNRKLEFEKAMDFLNITDYEIWNFLDNMPENIPAWGSGKASRISNRIRKVLNEKKYDKIVTHGPDGEYGHNQHKAVHQIVKNLVTENLFIFGKSEERLDKKVLFKKIDLLDIYYWQGLWRMGYLHEWIINESVVPYNE